jgi:hypothetical protein
MDKEARKAFQAATLNAWQILGNGFLQYRYNDELRELIASGRLSTTDYSLQVQKLVARLVFLMMIEDRGQIVGTEEGLRRYYQRYSLRRLRYPDMYGYPAGLFGGFMAMLDRLEQQKAGADDEDDDSRQWLDMIGLFALLGNEAKARGLGIAPLGPMFIQPDTMPDLIRAAIADADLLQVIKTLSEYTVGKQRYQFDYTAITAEDLGTFAEVSTGVTPTIDTAAWTFALPDGYGRKATGSYYTPVELVNELIKSAMEPVIEARLAAADEAIKREAA